MGGLALAILIAALLMIGGGALVLGLIGRAIARRTGARSGRRKVIIALTVIAGAGIGWLWMTATFHESTWAPPPQLRLTAAPGFDAPWVIMLEDPNASATISWSGAGMPFSGPRAVLAVPHSGIVRVRSLGELMGRSDYQITWPDGTLNWGGGSGPAPAETGARYFIALENPGNPVREYPFSGDPAALVTYIAQREARR